MLYDPEHGIKFISSFNNKHTYLFTGTRIFLKNISYSVVSSSQLLNESDHNKQVIREAFLNGLNEGVINPFCNHVTTISSINSTIFDTMT